MGSVDGSDDRTFRVNFSGHGAAKLRERVMGKLKEFMGDYTDDTLVADFSIRNVSSERKVPERRSLPGDSFLEYVIVLLRNGRQKEEARNELNVFLGDDSHSFVSWLWDHLSSNLDLYVEPTESSNAQTKPTSEHDIENNDLHALDSESERKKLNKLSRSRRNKEWKGLIRDGAEPPPLRSSEIDNIHAETRAYHKVDRSRLVSPVPQVHRKRSRSHERQLSKKGAISQATIHAPRRLLQFAVRDAVGTSRASHLSTEPTLKRLRSVVSTSTGDSSLVDRPRRIQSIARVPNPMETVIKAVAEAAEDVTKFKTSGSVFDRLGRGMDLSETSNRQFGEVIMEDGECGVNHIPEQTLSMYRERSDHSGQYAGNIAMLESDSVLASDSTSDNDGYDDVNVMGRRVTDVSQSGTSAGNRGRDSLMVQYSVAKNNDTRERWNEDQYQPAVVSNNSRKIVNISVNVNTWKPPHFDEPREVAEVVGQKSLPESESGAGKSSARIVKENNDIVSVGNGNAKPAVDTQLVSQKTLQPAPGLYSATRPSDDADSRTIFVSNVNFGATKDSLCRHFNKFGDVLKAVVVTDAATGQPKGYAYVEFMQKESANNALSLDGTSFMSRIIKVVRKNSAQQEAAPTMTWPHVARGTPFVAPRYPRLPFPRGYPGAFRPRPPIKPGARSMQWKRDGQATPADAGAQVPGNSIPPPSTPRSLTYVRPELRQDGNSGAA